MADSKRPFVLAILDGWGFSKKTVGNPIMEAKTPTIQMITQDYPMILLQASGLAVGMAWGETGNSEVGHLNIGSGRIVEQYYSRINRAIKNGSFFDNPAFVNAFNYAKENNSNVHLIGLLTTNTVHAAFPHLIALIEMAARNNASNTYIHLFFDGRDSGLQEGLEMLKRLEGEIAKTGIGKIATIIGRDFAMDRDNNWDRTQKAHELIVKAAGEKSDDLKTAIANYYQKGVNDSAIPPTVSSTVNYTGIKDNDALIFFNFREDSMRQILASFTDPNFSIFPRVEIKKLYVANMTKYLEEDSSAVAFSPPEIKNCLAKVLSSNDKTQMHIAETDKYAHVTYFFNALRGKPFDGETDVFIDSVKDIEKNPTMSSDKIADEIIRALDRGAYDFIVLNFANADILAHTGNYAATVIGVEAIDQALAKIIPKVLEKNGIITITADHGNAESLVYRASGEAETKHDDSPVSFHLIADEFRVAKDSDRLNQETAEINGILPDVAPTILELMNLPQPDEMTGKSLMTVLLNS